MYKQKLPDFYGILEVQHYIQGRIRVKIPSLIQDYDGMNSLKEQLVKLNGIKEVSFNLILGTLLIKFDENVIEPMMLLGVILNICGLEEEVFSKKNGVVSSTVSEVLRAVDVTIYNKTKGILDIKSVIGSVFSFYGIKKVRQNPIMPNGINLLWWAYNLMSKGGN